MADAPWHPPWTDENGDPTDRLHATYDPLGRRMDQCIECERPPTHWYLVDVAPTGMTPGYVGHSRVCDEHSIIFEKIAAFDGSVRPDPDRAQ